MCRRYHPEPPPKCRGGGAPGKIRSLASFAISRHFARRALKRGTKGDAAQR